MKSNSEQVVNSKFKTLDKGLHPPNFSAVAVLESVLWPFNFPYIALLVFFCRQRAQTCQPAVYTFTEKNMRLLLKRNILSQILTHSHVCKKKCFHFLYTLIIYRQKLHIFK